MTEIAAQSLQEEIAELEDWLLLNPEADIDLRVDVRVMIVRKKIKLIELTKIEL